MIRYGGRKIINAIRLQSMTRRGRREAPKQLTVKMNSDSGQSRSIHSYRTSGDIMTGTVRIVKSERHDVLRSWLVWRQAGWRGLTIGTAVSAQEIGRLRSKTRP